MRTTLLLLCFLCITLPFAATSRATAPLTRIKVKLGAEAKLTDVYVRLVYENEVTTSTTQYHDVVVYFYEDADGTIPLSVSPAITVNYRVVGFDGYNYFDYNSSVSGGSSYITIITGMEHDYNDGTTYRYRDYHLLPGDYISL